MKRSAILFLIAAAMFVVLAVVCFALPQEVLDYNEPIILWIVFPIMGWFWIQSFVDFMDDN